MHNNNKVKTICSYRRSRLAKKGIPATDMVRGCYPLGSHFSFEDINEPISITPISDMAQGDIIKATVRKLVAFGKINPNDCYCNALILALCLNDCGLNVKCVDGYYHSPNNPWSKHRFNELNGVYFDATAECFSSVPVQEFKYVGARLFSSKEMLLISYASGFLNDYPYGHFFESTLPYNPKYYNPLDEVEECYNKYCLDNDGYMRLNAIQ